MRKLAEVLEIHKGVTAFVGGGGKTSTIYELAQELSTQGFRVIVTTTTKMYIPKPDQVQALLLNPTVDKIKEAFQHFDCIGIGGGVQESKIVGITQEELEKMKEVADYVLVEADGAKCLPIKIPGSHEPVIPIGVDYVVAVVGMSGMGQKLEDCCFRKEEAMTLLDVDEVHTINKDDLVKIIISSNGLRKDVENRRFAVLLNQMDVIKDKNIGTYIASEVLKNKIDKVVLASLKEKRWWQEISKE